MVYYIKARPDLEAVLVKQEALASPFSIFTHEQIFKIFSKEILEPRETDIRSLDPILKGSFLQTANKHPIIPQHHKGFPLSAANACIQMLALNHVMPKQAHLLSCIPTMVKVVNGRAREAVEGHIERSLSVLNVRVKISVVPTVSWTGDKRIPFLGQLIQENGPCLVTVINHAEKKLEGHSYHYLMVDWIATYSKNQEENVLAAQVRDPSCEGYYLVDAAALQKVLVMGSKIFQIITDSNLPSPDSPSLEDRIPQTPKTRQFFHTRPCSILVNSPSRSPSRSPPLETYPVTSPVTTEYKAPTLEQISEN